MNELFFSQYEIHHGQNDEHAKSARSRLYEAITSANVPYDGYLFCPILRTRPVLPGMQATQIHRQKINHPESLMYRPLRPGTQTSCLRSPSALYNIPSNKIGGSQSSRYLWNCSSGIATSFSPFRPLTNLFVPCRLSAILEDNNISPPFQAACPIYPPSALQQVRQQTV